VEKIVASEEIDGIPHFKIRWAGFSPSKDTWEPPSNIKPDTILEYKLENNMLITPAELTAHDPLDSNNTMHFLNDLKDFNGFADADVQDDIAANLLELQPKCCRGTPGCKPEQHTRMGRDGRPRTRQTHSQECVRARWRTLAQARRARQKAEPPTLPPPATAGVMCCQGTAGCKTSLVASTGRDGRTHHTTVHDYHCKQRNWKLKKDRKKARSLLLLGPQGRACCRGSFGCKGDAIGRGHTTTCSKLSAAGAPARPPRRRQQPKNAIPCCKHGITGCKGGVPRAAASKICKRCRRRRPRKGPAATRAFVVGLASAAAAADGSAVDAAAADNAIIDTTTAA
jgi:hypothetical protein